MYIRKNKHRSPKIDFFSQFSEKQHFSAQNIVFSKQEYPLTDRLLISILWL